MKNSSLSVLQVQNLTKKFGERIAVNNANFSINAGEIVGFIGPNGAGKTTTIKMITGLTKITEGKVHICGHSIDNDFSKAVINIGAIIEGPDMYGYMSGLDNLKFFASISNKKVTRKRIDDIVKIVNLQDRINDKVKTYSLGMKQRLGIAQSLINQPKLLILDEPTNGLDPEGIMDIRKLIKYLAKQFKMAVLISSHNLKELQDICDKVIIINNGNIVDVKTINEIKSDSINQNKIEVIVDYPNYAGKIIMFAFKTKVEIDGRKVIFNASHHKILKIIQLLSAKNITVFGINSVQQNLEDIYFKTINN